MLDGAVRPSLATNHRLGSSKRPGGDDLALAQSIGQGVQQSANRQPATAENIPPITATDGLAMTLELAHIPRQSGDFVHGQTLTSSDRKRCMQAGVCYCLGWAHFPTCKVTVDNLETDSHPAHSGGYGIELRSLLQVVGETEHDLWFNARLDKTVEVDSTCNQRFAIDRRVKRLVEAKFCPLRLIRETKFPTHSVPTARKSLFCKCLTDLIALRHRDRALR